MLAFLEERRHREATKAAVDGDGASLATSTSSAPESSTAGAARADIEERVDA